MDLMIESFPRLLNATKLTIELTLLSLFFGIFVGVFFAILRTSKNKIFYYIAYYYSYIFRGTPLLVQIFIIYFWPWPGRMDKRVFSLDSTKRTLFMRYPCIYFKYRSIFF